MKPPMLNPRSRQHKVMVRFRADEWEHIQSNLPSSVPLAVWVRDLVLAHVNANPTDHSELISAVSFIVASLSHDKTPNDVETEYREYQNHKQFQQETNDGPHAESSE